MNQLTKGYLFGIAAYACWGLFPLYWRLLQRAGAVEILAHRIVWSCVFVALLITASRGWVRVSALARQPRKLGQLGIAAVLVAINWGTFIFGVNTGHIVECSLGYFINPLVSVLLGVFVLGERLRSVQWIALGLGAVAVMVLTVDYRQVPYLALTLAVSFGLYGLVKKQVRVPATDGLLLESAVLALPALICLGVLARHGESTFTRFSAGHAVLLMLAGAVTAGPLLLFAGAANRIPLSAIGLLQYLAPTLQLGCGVLIYGEPMPPVRLAGFALVWLALAVFSWDGIRHLRKEVRGPQPPPSPAVART